MRKARVGGLQGTLAWGVALLAPWATLPAATAQDATAQDATELADCARIADQAARLACYDDLAAGEMPAAESAHADADSAPLETPSTQGAAPTTAPVASRNQQPDAAQAAAEPAAETPAKRGFLRRLIRRDRATGKSGAEEPVVAGEIVRVAKLPLGNHQITLENGQVWRENEREMRTSYAVGDRITVFAAAFGSFNLTNERTGQSIKARRVK